MTAGYGMEPHLCTIRHTRANSFIPCRSWSGRTHEVRDNMAEPKQSVSPAYIQKYLAGIDYPANKQDLINHAKKNNADRDVISVLQDMPEQQYNSAADVSKAIGRVE